MRFFYTFLAAGVLFAIPFVSFGDTTGLVPECSGGGPFCQACDLLELVQNLINFAVYAATLVATLMFVYAGFLYVTASAAGQEQFKKARNIFVNVFIGFVVILIAWLVVDLIMKTFLGENGGPFGPWNQIECAEYGRVEVPIINPGGGLETGGSGGGSGGATRTPNCPDCEDITAFACKNSSSCSVAPSLNTKLEGFNESLGDLSDEVDISEGWPPTVRHQSACHYNGTCVDLRYLDRDYSSDRVRDIIDGARGSGLRAVFETNDYSAYSSLRRSLGTEYHSNLLYLGGITAPHFSVYCDDCD